MYQVLVSVILLSHLGAAIIFSQPGPKRGVANRGWRAATYRGLTVGRSTRADMLRVLGKPLSSLPTSDAGDPRLTTVNEYGTVTGDLPGTLTVEVSARSRRIVNITLSTGGMSVEEAVRHFGGDYRKVSYSFCGENIGDEESGLLYEDTGGRITYLEFRSRGVAAFLKDAGKVYSFDFRSEPPGLAAKQDCKGEIEKLRRKGSRD